MAAEEGKGEKQEKRDRAAVHTVRELAQEKGKSAPMLRT